MLEVSVSSPVEKVAKKKAKKFEYLNAFQKGVIESKYCHEKESKRETFDQAIVRLAENINKFDLLQKEEMIEKTIDYVSAQEFSPAGGPWRAAGNSVKKISAVNCTTQAPVKDSIEDIWDSIRWWARVASYGQGNGIDISGMRPRGTKTHNCAKTSTGAVSFLNNYDAAMQTIGAENRRGATKPDIWIYHPDSEEFITCKSDIKKLTSQNISIKVDDAFMKAVEKDQVIEQKWTRKGNKIFVGDRMYDDNSPGPDLEFSKKVPALSLFEQIAGAAWRTGEPGIEFWETSEKYSNSNYHPDRKYHVVSTNGCSEQKLDPWNTCILGSVNFYHMPIYEHINGNKYPEWRVWLEERVRFGIRFLDNVVTMEHTEDRSPHETQKKKLKDMTRIGLGYTGMADWFIKNEIVYGSKESIEVMDEVMRVFAEAAYRTSIELGKERGSFTEFDPEWFTKSEFVKRLCKLTSLKPDDFTHLRHVCCLSIAPTGTLSYVVGAGGSGVEPLFAPYFERKERATTGEYVTHYVFDNCVINECKRRGIELTKENVDKMVTGKEWVFAGNLNPLTKIDLMGTIGKYIDSGISVTYNLPKTATIQDIKEIYFKAWQAGLKSVTVYRDGSREGILSVTPATGTIKNMKIQKNDAPKRPAELPCDIHHLTVRGEKWIVLTGLMENDPYELFCGKQETVKLPQKFKLGKIAKTKRGHYELIVAVDEEDEMRLDIKRTFKNEASESALTRMISVSLRHGVDIKYVVQQLEKVEDDIMSFAKATSRVLKKYIADGTVITGEACPNCTSTSLVRQSGCVTCTGCGFSKC